MSPASPTEAEQQGICDTVQWGTQMEEESSWLRPVSAITAAAVQALTAVGDFLPALKF